MKEKIKMLIIFVLGGITIGGISVYAATVISSINVGYSNESSKLVATNVQGAIDELYQKSKIPNVDLSTLPNIVSVYEYNDDSDSNDYCISGDEKTCKLSNCYKTIDKDSCKPGTIVNYKVNDGKIVRFHVIKDNGSTLTLQSQKNTVYNVAWYKDARDSTKGPLTVLPVLEEKTKDWNNVNMLTYEMGKTVFEDNSYTTCSETGQIWKCTESKYTLPERSARARMITTQEVTKLGCKSGNQSSGKKSCPIWLYNYLYNTINVDDHVENGAIHNYGYWTMSSNDNPMYALSVTNLGALGGDVSNYVDLNNRGARAVVEITKP